MTTLIKTGSADIKNLAKAATGMVNEFWMRDWMEQLNFLRVDAGVFAENNQDDFCHYATS